MADNKSTVSILMANYNNAKYIGEAIESVLGQTVDEWELVIIDDCSTDNSEEIIKKYLSEPKVKFYKNKINLGYVNTLKILMERSRADIVGILDSDDVLYSQTIEEVLNIYNKFPEVGFVYTQFEYCDENLKPVEKGLSHNLNYVKSEIFKPRVGAFRSYRRSIYNKTSGYDEDILYAEDKDLILKMEEVTKFYFINEVLYKYRRVPDSQTSNPRKLQVSRASYELAKYKAFLRRQGTGMPNLSKCQMSYRLLDAVPSLIKIKDFKKAGYFIKKALKLCPINIFGYLMLIFRLFKFPLYRLYKILFPQKDSLLGAK